MRVEQENRRPEAAGRVRKISFSRRSQLGMNGRQREKAKREARSRAKNTIRLYHGFNLFSHLLLLLVRYVENGKLFYSGKKETLVRSSWYPG